MSTDTYGALTGQVAAQRWYDTHPRQAWDSTSAARHEAEHAATELPVRGGGGS